MADTVTLADRIDALERESNAVVSALDRVRKIRLCLILAVVLLIIVVGAMFYNWGKGLQTQPSKEAYLKAVQSQLEDYRPEWEQELQTAVNNVREPVNQAFTAQVEKDKKLYVDALMGERDILRANLEKRLQGQLKKHQDDILKKHESILKEEFPNFENEDVYAQMIVNMQGAMQDLVEKYYITEFKNELKILAAIWDDFPYVDAVEPGEPPLEEQLKGLLLEFLPAKMAESSRQSLEPEPVFTPKTKSE